MERQDIIFTSSVGQVLAESLNLLSYDKLFVLVDTTTRDKCLPLLQNSRAMGKASVIVIHPDDVHKNVDTLCKVWEQLSCGSASRKSVLVNLGGGMVTDLGGFAASAFKRGIKFINIPTTLLAMVDASVGGKTGVNFLGLKNEIGIFNNAQVVLVDMAFLATLDADNLNSGYAEMLKHGLISDADHWKRLVNFDLDHPDWEILRGLVERSVEVKQKVVLEDPKEAGIRKALNFGHTLGHAFESLAMEQGSPILHDHAVAWGMVGGLYLSRILCGFASDVMQQAVSFVRENYSVLHFDCKKYDRIYELMTHDKKNANGKIYATLLSGIGQVVLDQELQKEVIFEALDFVREG